MVARELFGNRAAPVAAMRTESPVSEFLRHQASPKVVDAKNRSVPRWSVGKTLTRQIGYNNVKGIFRLSTECHWVGEHRDNFRETIKRIGIAVGQYERKRIGTLPVHVNEVDADIVHSGFEMRELVERPFVLSPVVTVLPVI